METPDAKAVRECLHGIALAISSLEMLASDHAYRKIAEQARRALHEIAVLVNVDEDVEHGHIPPLNLEKERETILRQQGVNRNASASTHNKLKKIA